MIGMVIAFLGMILMNYGNQSESESLVFLGRWLVIAGALVFFAMDGRDLLSSP